MIIKSCEANNNKFHEEILYIASNYYIFKKRPNTKPRSLITVFKVYITLSLLLLILFLFIPDFEEVSAVFFTLLIISIYLYFETKYRLKEKLKYGDSTIDIDEEGIKHIASDKTTIKMTWDAIEYILINKYSICVLPKNFSSILIGIEKQSQEKVIKALKKYQKLDLIIDNSK